MNQCGNNNPLPAYRKMGYQPTTLALHVVGIPSESHRNHPIIPVKELIQQLNWKEQVVTTPSWKPENLVLEVNEPEEEAWSLGVCSREFFLYLLICHVMSLMATLLIIMAYIYKYENSHFTLISLSLVLVNRCLKAIRYIIEVINI